MIFVLKGEHVCIIIFSLPKSFTCYNNCWVFELMQTPIFIPCQSKTVYAIIMISFFHTKYHLYNFFCINLKKNCPYTEEITPKSHEIMADTEQTTPTFHKLKKQIMLQVLKLFYLSGFLLLIFGNNVTQLAQVLCVY